MNKIEQAVSRYEQGFACSQAILSTFGEEFGLDPNLALKITDPFGAGMRGLSETCGSVTGSLMVIGLKYGRTLADDLAAKEKSVLIVQEFVNRFKQRQGTIVCRELLGLDISIPEQHEMADNQGFFKTKCPNFVKDAAEILIEIL